MFNSVSLESYDEMKNVEMVTYFYPSQEALSEAGLTADVVLYVNNLRTAKEWVSTGQGKSGRLVGYYDFIVWDYKENKPMYWGRNNAISGFAFVCSTSTWVTLADKVYKEVLSKSPFLQQ